MRKPQPGWGRPALQERKPGIGVSAFAAMPSLSTYLYVSVALVFGRLLGMIDDDHIIGSLGRSHFKPQLLLDCGVKTRRSIGIIAGRRYFRAGPSELRELGIVRSPFQLEIVSVSELGLIHHRLVHHTRLHPGGKISHIQVSHDQIPKAPELE